MANKRVHLISNAHLDPVWLWEWEEGAAEALSTFRTAADLCEEFPGFIFNHNEAALYQWIEHYEPAMFARIARLVRTGRWHIMGGWYLQPDCNMIRRPSRAAIGSSACSSPPEKLVRPFCRFPFSSCGAGFGCPALKSKRYESTERPAESWRPTCSNAHSASRAIWWRKRL